MSLAQPANDNCATATVISSFPFIAADSGVTATDETIDITCNSGTIARRGVWYTFTAPASGTNILNFAETSTNDTAVALFTGTCGALTQVNCSDPESWAFTLTNGTTYYILVAMWSSTTVPTVAYGVTINIVQPPTNEDCATAKVISSFPYADGPAGPAQTDEVAFDVTCNSGTLARRSIWYTFTSSAAPVQTLSFSELSANDTAVALFTGSCGALTQVNCSDPESWTFALTPSTTYYIMVAMWSSTTVPTAGYQITANIVIPPANDACSGAIPVACGSSTAAVIDGATVDFPSSPTLTCGGTSSTATYSGKSGIWYSYVGDGNPVQFSTCNAGTNIDTVLVVFNGTCGALSCVIGNDDAGSAACSLSSLRSIVSFTTTNGTTYYIMVMPFSGSTGNVQLDVVCSLPLGVTCTAQSGAPSAVRVLNATVSPGTNPSSTGVAVSCDASLIGGGTVTMLDDGNPPDATAGDNIYSGNVTVGAVAVGSYSLPVTATDAQSRTATCNISFSVTAPPPANDDCVNAIPVACDSSTAGTIAAATIDFPTGGTILPCANTGDQAEYNDRRGVWYTVTGNGNTMRVSTCDAGTDFDTQIVVFSGVCGSLSCVAGNDDAFGGCTLSGTRSVVDFSSTLGTTYYVLVLPWFTTATTGNFVLNVVCTVPLGVACQTPSPSSVPAGGSTLLRATVTPGTNPASTGISVTVDASQIGAGTVTLLDDGNPPDATAGDNIYSANATVSGATTPGSKTLATTVTDAESRTATCNMTLTVTAPPPANDDCANAIIIPGVPYSVSANNDTATADGIAGSCNSGSATTMQNATWWSFTPSVSADYVITVDDTTFFDSIAVVSTGVCGAQTEITSGCGDEPQPIVMTVTLSAGTTYLIQIGDWGVSEGGGAFDFSIDAIGACCLGVNSTPPAAPRTCSPLTSGACTTAGGRYQGAGSVCTPGASCCPGDIDGDFDVDESDLGVLLGNWQTAQTPNSGGDLDGSGFVDEADLGILLGSWGCLLP
ncbi:MAG: choice-of-anchor X domain-containing protein [Phycisphaerae bacterium]